MSQVLNRALAIEPAQRYDSVEHFSGALNDAFHGKGPHKQTPTVFVSYRRAPSSAWAMMIQRELHGKHGIKVYVDAQRLDGARQFPERIARAVEECDVFVCLLATGTLKSPWVREEIRIAHAHHRPMIPIFQESFKRHLAPSDDDAVNALLRYDGLELLDRRNLYVEQLLEELVRQVRITLGVS